VRRLVLHSFIRFLRAEELLAVGEYIANGTAFTKGCGFAARLGAAQMSTGDRTILGLSASAAIAISALLFMQGAV
jgi:hypothetical protein